MQVLILAAGESSRFFPFNNRHKSLVMVMGKTILEHTLESVKKAGFTDVIIVSRKDGEIQTLVGDGEKYGITITHVSQDQPSGAGDAILLAKDYIKEDFFVINACRVEFNNFADLLQKAQEKNDECVLLAKEVSEIKDFGALKIEGNRVLEIIEKPRELSPSNLKVVGIYLFSKTFIKTLEQEKSHHYSLESAISSHAKNNVVRFVKTSDETVSLKYPWDLLQIKDYLLTHQEGFISKNAEIAESAKIIGKVTIEDGVKIMEHVTIKGPCYIGKNAYIGTNAILRNMSCIEEETLIGANMEVKNSIIGRKTTTHSGYIGDSVIGAFCKIAAFFCTANVRLDRKNILSLVKEEKVDTGLRSLGVIMGGSVSLGIRTSTMPGIIIGENTVIGPHTSVMHNVKANMRYFTKFQEVVEEKNER